MKASVSNLKDLTVRGYRIRDGHRHQTLAAYRKIYERDQSAPLSRTVTDRDQRHFLPAELLAADKTGALYWTCAAKRKRPSAWTACLAEPWSQACISLRWKAVSVIRCWRRTGCLAVPSENGGRRSSWEKEASYAAQAVVQVTDLGVLHKKTADTMFAYVYSLSTGKAVEKRRSNCWMRTAPFWLPFRGARFRDFAHGRDERKGRLCSRPVRGGQLPEPPGGLAGAGEDVVLWREDAALRMGSPGAESRHYRGNEGVHVFGQEPVPPGGDHAF